MESYLKRKFNSKANYKNALSEYKWVKVDPMYKTWARFYMAVHWTTAIKAQNILKDWKIYSHSELSKMQSSFVSDRMELATDKLDIRIWADNYVFLNVWRVHPWDLQDVYFCFRNDIIEQAWNLVSMKEIVHHGWIVSDESARIYLQNDPKLDIEKRNKEAIKKFFDSLLEWKDFHMVFEKFLSMHYSEFIHCYLSDLIFPWDTEKFLIIDGLKKLYNSYEWPQLMVPKSIDIEENLRSILIITQNKSKVDMILNSGFPKSRIYELSEVIALYEETVKSKMTDTNKYFFVNLALKDIALIKHNNRLSINAEDSMIWFRNRIKDTVL